MAEAVIKADDIQSGFEIFKERLLNGWWRGDKNFVGNFWVALPPRDRFICHYKWHAFSVVIGTRVTSDLIGVEFDLPKATLGEGPLCFHGKGVGYTRI